MPDLLLEVLSEEIPARMQADGANALKEQVTRRLKEARLVEFEGEDVKSFSTPRRLALIVPGLPGVQPDITVERKGPRVDAPQKAIEGFLKSTGLTLADCEQRETPKGPVWFAVNREKGRPTAEVLADLLPAALAAVSWPKSMRWEASGTRWVRPIRSILCLLDTDVVPFRFAAVDSGRTTLGHRFLSSGPLTVGDTGSYEAILRGARVMLDPAQRAINIADAAEKLVQSEGLSIAPDELLVIENAGLVECPKVLMGSIDEAFMDLPPEVLRSAMGKHQRYFGVLDEAGRPAPRFVTVANIETESDCAAVVAGNERVLRARLGDARFFWDQDQRKKLEEYVPELEGVVFHARLGSMAGKARRVESLALVLSSSNYVRGFDHNNPNDAARAGLLCKADLVTEMVGEFPDLQGIMGRYYAEAGGETPAVCEAIREHHAPQGPNDLVPSAPVSVAVALADKLDTLAGFFAIDERPTGSKDPFALRRAALGVIRLIVENGRRLPLREALDDALAGYDELLPRRPGREATRDALLAFFADRLRVHLRDKGERHDLVNAVFAVSGEDDLVRLLARVDALAQFLDAYDGANLLTAYRRAANILRIEEKKDGERYEGEPDTSLFQQEEECSLHGKIAETAASADAALAKEPPHFLGAMMFLATLRAPVDTFFDNVTVNCEEPALRRNRLLMLSQIRATLDRVADFSKIEG